MNKRDKTITFKGKGNLFIPRNVIRSEYPETNNNDGNDNNNNNNDSEIYLNLYKPDAYGVIDDQLNYHVFDNLLDAANYRFEHDIMFISALYLRNDLEFQKCILNIEPLVKIEEEHIVDITGICYDVRFNDKFSLIQFGDTNYYYVGINFDPTTPIGPK